MSRGTAAMTSACSMPIGVTPIYVFLGTKAQYIKTAPLMRLLQERKIDYCLIDSGQHAAFTKSLRKELGVKEPDVVLADRGNIKSVFAATLWFAKYALIFLFGRRYLEREIFVRDRGICFLHGDTPSTLLGLMLAKRTRQKVVHIEAGLRSHNILKPFPEELIRIICMWYSDILLAPSAWAYDNIKKMGVRGIAHNVGQNTNVEALYFSLGQHPANSPQRPYCMMTIHRVETILSRRRLSRVVQLAEEIARSMKTVFVLHDPTVVKLKQFCLLDRIKSNPNIDCTELVDHTKFLKLLESAEFVVTDGGSIQEESYYLDIPCLVMRTETERQEGLGGNVVISNFDEATIATFLQNYPCLRRGQRAQNKRPSEQILDIALREMAAVG